MNLKSMLISMTIVFMLCLVITTVNAKDIVDELCDAASNGDCKKVINLIDAGADINGKHSHFELSPLHTAASTGHTEVVQLLINKGADLCLTNQRGETALHFAAKWGYVEIVRILLEKDPTTVNMKNRGGETPLLAAVCPVHHLADDENVYVLRRSVVSMLIEHGANVNEKDKRGHTPLHWAAMKNEIKMAELLIAGGANMNAVNNNGRTPLDSAEFRKNTEMVSFLKRVSGQKVKVE